LRTVILSELIFPV